MDVKEVRGLSVFRFNMDEQINRKPLLEGYLHGESCHKSYPRIKSLRDCNHKGSPPECGRPQRLLNYLRVNTIKSALDLSRRKVNTECLQWQQ